MRINFIIGGSRGDIQPFIPLALGLQRAGYTVQITTHSDYRDWVCGYGIEYAQMEGNARAIMESEQGLRLVESKGLGTLRELARLTEPLARQATHDILAAAPGSDLLVGSFSSYGPVYSVAQKLGIPWMMAMLQPMHPTRAFPGFPVTDRRSAGAVGNYLSHLITDQAQWLAMRAMGNRIRREVLGMQPYPLLGPLHAAHKQRIPTIYGFSPSVVPQPHDWGEHICVTGYWFLDEPDWSPPPELADFLAAGDPPVYIGFGSMSLRDPQRLAEIVLGALEQSRQRGILLAGWGGLKASNLPDTVLKIESAPHAWLFPRMAAVVHHGGAGTTGAGLRAGAPSIVTPLFADQPWWGRRVFDLGVGPEPVPHSKLTADNLAAAIRQAVGDPAMRDRAARLSEKIRAEDGVAQAVEFIERRVAKRAPGPAPLAEIGVSG